MKYDLDDGGKDRSELWSNNCSIFEPHITSKTLHTQKNILWTLIRFIPITIMSDSQNLYCIMVAFNQNFEPICFF